MLFDNQISDKGAEYFANALQQNKVTSSPPSQPVV
jgi:hypothetical protein